jgi:hypothetical protein
MHSPRPANPIPLASTLGRMIALTAMAAAGVTAMLLGFGLEHHLMIALSTAGVCLPAAGVAVVPLCLLAGRYPEGVVHGAMIAMPLRIALSLGGAALLIYVGGLSQTATAGWMTGWYVALLAAEVAVLVRVLRATQRQESVEKEAVPC